MDTMDTTELAARLNNSEYPVAIPKELSAEAKAAGLVIVFGRSDDLMEFEGAIQDEIGCWDGGTVYVDTEGLLPDFETLKDEGDQARLRDWFRREPHRRAIEALWCVEDKYSWTYWTDIPHETFDVLEDGKPYCRGIVFRLSDLTAPRHD